MTTKKKTAAAKKPTKKATAKKLSALDAAAQVLTEGGGSMTTKEMIEAMAQKNLWQSPNGKTPAATLYSAILREVTTKGKDSRFQKPEPGKFAATGATGKVKEITDEEKPKAAKPKATKGTKTKATKKKATESATIPGGAPGTAGEPSAV
jgi:hypothetical protein